MSRARSFVHEWIDLVERSGLLVSEPVLHRFFPGGPEHVEPRRQRALLSAWERFQVDPSDAQRQAAWLNAVFFGLLEWPEDRLVRSPRLPQYAVIHLPELDQNLRPFAILAGEGDRFLQRRGISARPCSAWAPGVLDRVFRRNVFRGEERPRRLLDPWPS
jgi:hypothetical protein